MINFDDVVKENIKEDNANWPEIPDDLYRYSFLIIDATPSSDNSLHLRFYVLNTNYGNWWCDYRWKNTNDFNREAAETSALSSVKIDKYEYLTGEELLPSNQSGIIEQAKFTYSPLDKAFEKQIKLKTKEKS